MSLYKGSAIIIALIITIMLCFSCCPKIQRREEYQLFEKTMAELSQQKVFHVSLRNENSLDGISQEAVYHEIWKSSDNAAMTIHLPNGEQNTLYYEGVFYAQHEADGKYEIIGDRCIMPDLWPNILNTTTSERITSSTLQHTETGEVLTILIKPDVDQKAEISATLTINSDGNVSSIITTAEWKQIIDEEIHTITTTQTTVFLPSDETDITRVISDRAINISE